MGGQTADALRAVARAAPVDASARGARFAAHLARPFVRFIGPPIASPVASRRDLMAAHWHIARHDRRAEPGDYDPKHTEVLGMKVSFFNWHNLHILFDEVFVESCYAFEPTSDAPRIIDAGANIGVASLWFARAFPSARITAIEPDPATFATLEANMVDNGIDRVEPIAAALAGHTGTIDLMIDPLRPGFLMQSVDRDRLDGVPVTVPALRLSEVIDGPVDLLKLDVEGAEHDVITELATTGALSEVKALSMEYHHHIDPTVDRFGEMLAILERHGFTYRITASGTAGPAGPRSVGAFQDIAVQAIRRRVA
jgi:FkbM family methyltransferase